MEPAGGFAAGRRVPGPGGRDALGGDPGAARRPAGPGDRPGRAALLHLLDTATTTTDLARLTGMSAGNVSQHLAALHAAGLVSRSRQGRHVLYRDTDAARVLLRASRGG